jgi:hypothetical protein
VRETERLGATTFTTIVNVPITPDASYGLLRRMVPLLLPTAGVVPVKLDAAISDWKVTDEGKVSVTMRWSPSFDGKAPFGINQVGQGQFRQLRDIPRPASQLARTRLSCKRTKRGSQ